MLHCLGMAVWLPLLLSPALGQHAMTTISSLPPVYGEGKVTTRLVTTLWWCLKLRGINLKLISRMPSQVILLMFMTVLPQQ